jgi:hypothetical protein
MRVFSRNKANFVHEINEGCRETKAKRSQNEAKTKPIGPENEADLRKMNVWTEDTSGAGASAQRGA